MILKRTSGVRLLCLCFSLAVAALSALPAASPGDDLQSQLVAEGPAALATAARDLGDAQRGAVVFYQQYMACTKCHIAGDDQSLLGPDLSKVGKEATDAYLIESILDPSKVIKQGYEPVTVVTMRGKSITGLIAQDEKDKLVLRDPAQPGKLITVLKSDIDQRIAGKVSIMPAGQAGVLAGRQQFLDLLRYLFEIRDGGPEMAAQLEPPPSLYATQPLPEYEKHVDHAAMIADAGKDSIQRGEAIYQRVCANCHGTHDQPGSLPTSRKFASDPFKNGSDPYTMYQTITRGFGMMVPQTWMVPQQKYDVIHYIREAYLKQHNSTQYFAVDQAYLDRLPKGDTRGPAPAQTNEWEEMDYGPNQVLTLEIGSNATNFAYKGNAIRLDHGQGGVSKGRYWMIFDYDTMRVAAAWSGQGFIDWNSIHFNGRHAIHPRLAGQLHFANPTGPGWANPENGSFEDTRLVGRDNRIYGPLPRTWAQYKGMYYHGNDTILSYTVGETSVLELPGLEVTEAAPVFKRTFNVGPRSRELVLQVAHRPESQGLLAHLQTASAVVLGMAPDALPGAEKPPADKPPVENHPAENQPAAKPIAKAEQSDGGDRVTFNGGTRVEVARAADLNMTDADYTVAAVIKTNEDGSIFAKTAPDGDWVANGKTLFLRGGRLAFDIGWVGDTVGRSRVADGKPHHVAAVFRTDSGQLSLYVDGKLDARRVLRPSGKVDGHIVRIGFTTNNFPRSGKFFRGDISQVRFYQRALADAELAALAAGNKVDADKLAAAWDLAANKTGVTLDATAGKHDGKVLVGAARSGQPGPVAAASGNLLVAGIAGDADSLEWSATADGNLRLTIAKGEKPLRFTLYVADVANASQVDKLVSDVVLDKPARDLAPLTRGGPKRWPGILTTRARIAKSDGPFVVDVLTHPVANPWHCRMRLTGFDFYPDGDRAAISAWDGSVYLVTGLKGLAAAEPADEGPELTWQRIASGLFQPLGVKIVDERIYVTCRDALYILNDLNGDGEADFLESFNSDHQVTDHFHEFAMGLQTDKEGNFYYAKSARHALTALVPHHGTLLRVSKDGSRTDIVANGFRAANGVCINPDGTFIVTDQEGHWNPKNRINWVKPGGFYGNMFGYHDVTDSSDDAMQQPLCWITNAFDRSPAELLWVDSKAWGPLDGMLLNFSYGYGKVFVVPHEEIDGQMQGGMCALPIPSFPTGVMRGRFHPGDGQLYCCGMFAWAGNQSQPGGFYRLRYTGQPVYLPVALKAKRNGMQLTLSGEVDRQVATNPGSYAVKVWGLKRTANYGSPHVNEHAVKVASARLNDDGKTIFLEIPEMAPTWCMEIKYTLKTDDGKPLQGVIHNTVHKLGEPEA